MLDSHRGYHTSAILSGHVALRFCRIAPHCIAPHFTVSHRKRRKVIQTLKKKGANASRGRDPGPVVWWAEVSSAAAGSGGGVRRGVVFFSCALIGAAGEKSSSAWERSNLGRGGLRTKERTDAEGSRESSTYGGGEGKGGVEGGGEGPGLFHRPEN